MMKKILSILIVLIMIFSTPVFAEEQLNSGKAASKLARGMTNLATCWGEYIVQMPKSVDKTPDYLTGLFYDIFRGTAYTIRRAGVGLYDVVTCPFPGTTNYGPVAEPETIFTKTADYLSN